MNIDYLIIGQGISGTWLSYYLQKENKSFIVIDKYYSNSPSRIAAGIINPVTGRRHVEVWLADEIIPFANKAYTQFGNELGITAFSQKNIIFTKTTICILNYNNISIRITYINYLGSLSIAPRISNISNTCI